jgi:hypothetical protein
MIIIGARVSVEFVYKKIGFVVVFIHDGSSFIVDYYNLRKSIKKRKYK